MKSKRSFSLNLRLNKNGCPTSPMGKSANCIDIIRFSPKQAQGLFEEIGPLYQKGLSISDISEQTGFKRGAVWRELKKHVKDLRAQDPISFDRWRKGHGKTRARPPYGFCYFQGEVIKSPTEYPTLLLIQSLWKRQASISTILDTLSSKKLKSRTGKAWSYNVIKSILRRFDDGTIDRLLITNAKPKRSKR
ncbi:MAG: hypothetical protein EOP06_07165 [Proteobacteria bacterium]|nr:MAG: hypothetical protein EOP06_07165 [Pseudomonadota bacterium]